MDDKSKGFLFLALGVLGFYGMARSLEEAQKQRREDLANSTLTTVQEINEYDNLGIIAATGGFEKKENLVKLLVSKNINSEVVRDLKKSGYSWKTIEDMAIAGFDGNEYLEWKKEGFNAHTMIRYKKSLLNLDDAIEWKNQGFGNYDLKFLHDEGYRPEHAWKLKPWTEIIGIADTIFCLKKDYKLEKVSEWVNSGFDVYQMHECKINNISLDLAKDWKQEYSVEEMVTIVKRRNFLQDYDSQPIKTDSELSHLLR